MTKFSKILVIMWLISWILLINIYFSFSSNFLYQMNFESLNTIEQLREQKLSEEMSKILDERHKGIQNNIYEIQDFKSHFWLTNLKMWLITFLAVNLFWFFVLFLVLSYESEELSENGLQKISGHIFVLIFITSIWFLFFGLLNRIFWTESLSWNFLYNTVIISILYVVLKAKGYRFEQWKVWITK